MTEPIHYLGSGCPSWADHDGASSADITPDRWLVTCQDCRDAIRAQRERRYSALNLSE